MANLRYPAGKHTFFQLVEAAVDHSFDGTCHGWCTPRMVRYPFGNPLKTEAHVCSVMLSDGNMAWRNLCAKHNMRDEELVHQISSSPEHCPSSIDRKTCRTQCVDRSWKILKAYLHKKKLLKDPLTKSLSPFFLQQVHETNLGHFNAVLRHCHLTVSFGDDATG